MTTLGNIEKLILVTKINDKVVECSTNMDEKTKEAFINLSKLTRDILEKEPKMNSYGLNSLKSGLLTYWNESINPDTEFFWTELKVNGIDYERKEPLKYALEKNQFRRVEQGMDSRMHWGELKKRKEITDKYSKAEIEKIETIIAPYIKGRRKRPKEIPELKIAMISVLLASLEVNQMTDRNKKIGNNILVK